MLNVFHYIGIEIKNIIAKLLILLIIKGTHPSGLKHPCTNTKVIGEAD